MDGHLSTFDGRNCLTRFGIVSLEAMMEELVNPHIGRILARGEGTSAFGNSTERNEWNLRSGA